MMKLYQVEWCPYCARVRERMGELCLSFINVYVPQSKTARTELMEVSGQAGVPTLVTEDGMVIADDDDAIIAYLNQRFGG